MIKVYGLLFAFMLADAFVWARIDRSLRHVRASAKWRALLATMMLAAIAFAMALIVANDRVGAGHRRIPSFLPAAIYIWHFLILPPVILLIFAHALWRGVFRRASTRNVHPPQLVGSIPASDAPPPRQPLAEAPQPAAPGEYLFSRRHFLAAGALLAPPTAALTLAGISTWQIGDFRVKPYHLFVRGLPPKLDGYRIALVADIHVGIFSTPRMLHEITVATNNLRADLIFLGGDLINISHADLPSALDMIARLDCKGGVYMIQGNHDVIEGVDSFNDACWSRGVNLLVDDVATLRPRGVPLQILGTRWEKNPYAFRRSMETFKVKRDRDAFPIVLAHHPHTFDYAADEYHLPLVLAGHTHGGQIMLTSKIGAGPLRFRYWSGIYKKPNSTLLVSNGVGNWFPLRVNAPAEICDITLHPAREN